MIFRFSFITKTNQPYLFYITWSGSHRNSKFVKGHHIIIVAFMSMTSSCDPPSLQDYVQSDTAEPDSGTLSGNFYLFIIFKLILLIDTSIFAFLLSI